MIEPGERKAAISVGRDQGPASRLTEHRTGPRTMDGLLLHVSISKDENPWSRFSSALTQPAPQRLSFPPRKRENNPSASGPNLYSSDYHLAHDRLLLNLFPKFPEDKAFVFFSLCHWNMVQSKASGTDT